MKNIILKAINEGIRKSLLQYDDPISFSSHDQDIQKISKTMVNNFIYGFNDCQLGDVIRYSVKYGINLLEGKKIGQCCCTANQMPDGKARFWSISKDIPCTYCTSNKRHVAWNRVQDMNKEYFDKNDFYSYLTYNSHLTEKSLGFIHNINGYKNTEVFKQKSSKYVYTIVNLLKNYEYIPEIGELGKAYENFYNGENIRKLFPKYNYWTSTIYNYGNSGDKQEISALYIIDKCNIFPTPQTYWIGGLSAGSTFYET